MRLGARLVDGERRDIDANDLEAALRQVDRIDARAAPNFRVRPGAMARDSIISISIGSGLPVSHGGGFPEA